MASNDMANSTVPGKHGHSRQGFHADSLGALPAPLFSALLAVYLVVTFSLSSRFRYNLYPDSTSYLSIAQAYARGQFWDAVNGYWAPLYCWLLAPLLAAGVDVLLAPTLLALLVGVLTFVGLRRLGRRLGLAEGAVTLVLIAAGPSVVAWSLTYATPDFLLVGILVWYVSAVLGWSPSCGARAGLMAGALAGMAALAKQYALPFVVVHLALAGGLHYQQHRARHARAVLGWVIAAYLVLFAMVGPWIAAMSTKYGRLTVAASGTYNWYLPLTGFNVGTRTLAPPPFAGAVSAWVDPTPYAQTAPSRVRQEPVAIATKWSDWALDAVIWRTPRFAVMVEQFSFLGLAILAAAIVLAVRDGRRSADYRCAHLVLALGVYIGGYQIITAWFVERLVWIVMILLAVLGGLLFQRLAGTLSISPRMQTAGAIVFVLSFWPLPALRTAEGWNDGRELHDTALVLAQAGVGGRLASLNQYADSLRVAFFTGSSYYGRIAPPATLDRVLSELRTHEIDFLLIWAEKNPEASAALHRQLAERFPDAAQGKAKELSVLDVRGITPAPAGHQFGNQP